MNFNLVKFYRFTKIARTGPALKFTPFKLMHVHARMFCTPHGKLAACRIPERKDCKYILIKKKEGDDTCYFIRGDEQSAYHKHIWESFKQEEIPEGEDDQYEVVGGGIIQHVLPDKLHIGGKSQAYGAADHTVARDLLMQCYSDRKIITESNDWSGVGDKFL